MKEEEEKIYTQMRRLPKMPAIALLAGLFLEPAASVLAVQTQRSWMPALLCVFLLLSGASCYKGTLSYREYSLFSERVMDVVGRDLSPVEIRDGKLLVNEKVSLPYVRKVDDFFVEVSADGMEKKDFSRKMPETSGCRGGLRISPVNVLAWADLGRGNNSVYVDEVLNESKFKVIEEALGRDGVKSMELDYLQQLRRQFCVGLYPIVVLFHFGCYWGCLLLCFAGFYIGSVLMRASSWYSFSDLLIIGINISFPPVVFSTVWYMAFHGMFSFCTIFFIAYILYIFYLNHRARLRIAVR